MTSPLMAAAPILAASSGFESAGAATMAGTMAGAAEPVTAIIPPGADDASIAAAAGTTARGVEMIAALTQLSTVRELFGATIGASGAAYTATDVIGAAILSV